MCLPCRSRCAGASIPRSPRQAPRGSPSLPMEASPHRQVIANPGAARQRAAIHRAPPGPGPAARCDGTRRAGGDRWLVPGAGPPARRLGRTAPREGFLWSIRTCADWWGRREPGRRIRKVYDDRSHRRAFVTVTADRVAAATVIAATAGRRERDGAGMDWMTMSLGARNLAFNNVAHVGADF